MAARDLVRAPEAIGAARIVEAPSGIAYLAVGPEYLREAAGPLLDLRRSEGLSAAYVSLEAATDTFGLGRYGAGAIAHLVRHIRPQYVLLVGDNGYDYRDLTGKGVDPMVPSVLVSTAWLCETNADGLFGDLDLDGVPDIPVGRLPVRTPGELAAYVAKVVGRAASGSFPTGILFADDADDDGDFPAAQRRIAEAHGEVVWTELYLGIHGGAGFVRERLTQSVNAGADLVVYQGHGMTSWLANSPWQGGVALLDTEEAARWEAAPVVYLSTCWSAYIQRNMECAESIAEVLLRSPEGAVAVIGSTTLSTQHEQEALLGDFLAVALSGGEGASARVTAIGEAMVAAQRRAASRSSGEALPDTVRCYSVLGDPAMPLLVAPAGVAGGQ